MEEKRYLTVKEVSEAIGLRPATIYQWIERGWIRSKDIASSSNSGKRTRKVRRIPVAELRRVQKKIEIGLPVG